MFVADEIQAPVSGAAAAARLASMAGAGFLDGVSRAAWLEGITRAGPPPGLPWLARVRFREPVRRGTVTVLTLRWEAASPDGALFPALDADITFAPHGQDTLIGLHGVYRSPGASPGTAVGQALQHRVAAATVRALLTRIADAITMPGGLPAEPGAGARAPDQRPVPAADVPPDPRARGAVRRCRTAPAAASRTAPGTASTSAPARS